MDLIYTNSAREDLGVLLDYELDLAFGADENNFECRIASASHCCEAGSLLYMEGTEYGGIVDSIQSDTEAQEITYIGRTWHGILNSKVLEPDSGADYLVLSGEANAVIATLIERMSLSSLFEASSERSGLTIKSYKMNRYITGYDGIIKMLGTVNGKLKMAFHNGKVVLSAVERHDYTQDEEFDADLVPFQAKRNFKSVNHLICLGSGELAERLVVHLYADEDGNISQTQTQKGIDEVSAIYEYSSVGTEAELITEGTKEFEGLLASDEISIDFDVDSDAYDVGDIVGAVDNITGLSANASIAKKIVTIKNGQITISLSPDTAKSGSSMEVGGSGSGTITAPTVHALSLSDGIVAGANNSNQCYKDCCGIVHVKILARSNNEIATSTVIATLPEGLRPSAAFYTGISGLSSLLQVGVDGTVALRSQKVSANVMIASEFTFVTSN